MATNRSAFDKWWAKADVSQATSGAEPWRSWNIKRLCKRAFERGRSVGRESAKAEVKRLRELEEVVKEVYHYGHWRVEDDADVRRQIDLWQRVKDLLRG